MRRFLIALALCAATGCGITDTLTRNLIVEPLKYPARHSKRKEINRNRELAIAAWQDVLASSAGCNFSADYAQGFQDGFTDFLTYGGNGQPPYTPPRHYWGMKYQTPAGYAAVQDWFAGFRYGASAANGKGYRQYLTIPSAGGIQTPTAPTQANWPPPQPGWPDGFTTSPIPEHVHHSSPPVMEMLPPASPAPITAPVLPPPVAPPAPAFPAPTETSAPLMPHVPPMVSGSMPVADLPSVVTQPQAPAEPIMTVPLPSVSAASMPAPIEHARVMNEPSISTPVVPVPSVPAPSTPAPVVPVPIVSTPSKLEHVAPPPSMPAPIVAAPSIDEPSMPASSVPAPITLAPVVSSPSTPNDSMPATMASVPPTAEPVVTAPSMPAPVISTPSMPALPEIPQETVVAPVVQGPQLPDLPAAEPVLSPIMVEEPPVPPSSTAPALSPSPLFGPPSIGGIRGKAGSSRQALVPPAVTLPPQPGASGPTNSPVNGAPYRDPRYRANQSLPAMPRNVGSPLPVWQPVNTPEVVRLPSARQ